MIFHKFCKSGLAALAMTITATYTPASSAALSFSENFEGFTGTPDGYVGDCAKDPACGGNVPGGFFIGNIVGSTAWFPGPPPAGFYAPGDYNNGFSAIVTEQGGPDQGVYQLSIFNDYNPFGPFPGNPDTDVTSFVLNDLGIIDATDVGKTYIFSFDAKLGNIVDPWQAEAFMKVIKTSDGSGNELAYERFDSDALLTKNWGGGSIEVLITEGMVGELLQIGFNSTSQNYGATGIYYDNLNVAAIPVPAAVWLFGSGLIGLVGVARRRKGLT